MWCSPRIKATISAFSTIAFIAASGFISYGSPEVAVHADAKSNSTHNRSAVKSGTMPVMNLGDHSKNVLALQASLATLGYIPENARKLGSSNVQFTSRFPHMPQSLQALWHPGVYDELTEGAVMEFEEENHLGVDGIAGPQVQAALRFDLRHHIRNAYGYTYAYVSEHQPEQLTLWHNGHIVLTTLVNTGVAAAPTALGTFPIYLRYVSQTMSGTLPNGRHYQDPGVPYVNYFNGGDAIHGFVRSGYGYPQSVGCVELPVDKAKVAWSWLHYGTLVTVSSTPFPSIASHKGSHGRR